MTKINIFPSHLFVRFSKKYLLFIFTTVTILVYGFLFTQAFAEEEVLEIPVITTTEEAVANYIDQTMVTNIKENNVILDNVILSSESSFPVQDFLNIIISSDSKVDITKEISPGSSIVFIPAVNKEKVNVLLENLPNRNLYFYVDSLEEVIQYSAKEDPIMIFSLDGNEPHLIFIKSQHSTKTIRNDATGGDCSIFGTWSQDTLTCTMTQDVFEVIEIVDDGITLDGNGYIVKWNNGMGIGSGINISFRNNITVKNLIVEGFDNGFGVFQTRNSSFLNNETRGFGMGFYISFNDSNILINGNLITNRAGYLPDVDVTSTGIYLGGIQRATIINNTISVTNYGLVMIPGVNNNKVYNNNFLSTPAIISFNNSGNYLYQPMPIGGNYYRNYDTPEEGCNDINNDFICDTPISFGNVTDNFPWIYKNGWKGERVPDKEECLDCFSNVLFLPGFEGSRLYRQKTILSIPVEDQLWEPNWNTDVEDLYLNPDGTSIDPDIYTRDIIQETNVLPMGLLGINIYKSFANVMNDMVDNFEIADWRQYAYDWRQGVEDIVEDGTKYENGIVTLIDTLQGLVNSSKNGKVTIIAHSNGGLVAKAFLKKLQEDKLAGRNNLIDSVDVLIIVASPEIGTASAVPAMMHGYDQKMVGGLLLDETRARELGRNMNGAYGLLPSREYMNRVSASPVTFVDDTVPSGVTTKLIDTFGSALNSYTEYKDFLLGDEGRVDPIPNQTNLPINLSENLFAKAESLHDNIDAFIPPESLRVIEVAGWGLDTVASYEYYPKLVDCGLQNYNSKCYTLDERPRFTSGGDKTVVVPSAHYMGFLGNAEKYWVDLRNHNTLLKVNREHKDILEVGSLNNFIQATLKKEDIVFDNVLKNTEPIDDSNRLRLSIHSPVTFDAYDIDGNHTGKICPIDSDFCYVEENIPNSSYMEFGEGEYINLPEDQLSKIKLQGTDIGTFTYESEKVLPDGTSTVSSFVDIPITTQTQVEIVLNSITQVPELKLDVTGDGVMDFIITPKDEFDPILFLNIMKKNVESFDISKQQKSMLLKRIDDTIKAIQKGKINKVKLKIEQFKKALTIHPKENGKDREEREKKNEREHEKENKENKKPKSLAPADVQTLIIMLNQLLDNLN